MYKLENHNRNEQNLVKKICQQINSGSFSRIIELLSEYGAYKNEARGTVIREAIGEAIKLWSEHTAAIHEMEPYSASEFLFAEWNHFMTCEGISVLPEQILYSLKIFVFSRILKGYLELYNLSGVEDVEILTKIGIIYKELGNYEQAIQSFEIAHKQRKDDPVILLLLADCYAQVDEIRAAKLFFREAFFIAPEVCSTINCEAAFIKSIFNKMREEKIGESLLYFWLPVYATLLGVFNVKRELKPVEIGKLKQAIFELEQDIPDEKRHPDRARLINNYFWLLDHFENINAQKQLKDEVLLKIKNLDEVIYELYVH